MNTNKFSVDESSSRQFNDHFDQSVSAILLFSSSCQAILQSTIDDSASGVSWYDEVNSKLLSMQKLVIDWREGGNLYFNNSFIEKISTASQVILSVKPKIEVLFDQIAIKYDDSLRDQLLGMLNSIVPGINSIHDYASSYSTDLNHWGQEAENVHQDMVKLVGEIQAAEAQIKDTIDSINQQIADANQQIDTDRKAISDAEKSRTTGIIETVFGAVFAPFTGGASLILLGVGVASIVEAEQAIARLKSTIQDYQNQISNEQSDLSKDEKLVSALGVISAGLEVVVNDYKSVASSVDALQTTVVSLQDEIETVISKIAKAKSASEIIAQRVWFEAACTEWSAISDVSGTLYNAKITINYSHI